MSIFRDLINHLKVFLSDKHIELRTIPGIGIICTLISVMFWSAAGLCFKISDEVHALEVFTVSASIQSFIYLLVMLSQKHNHFGDPKERVHLFLRCTLGTISLACLYSSYRLITLSDGTTIRFTAPLFVSLFAFILLGEPFGPIHILSSAITITGVLLIGRPTFLFESAEVMSKETIIGLLLALVSAISIAISMTVMRRLQKTSSAVVIFWFSFCMFILGLISLWILDEFKWPKKGETWLIMVLAGLCGAADQIFITSALKFEHAGPVAMVQALNVVLSFIFSATILNEQIRITSVIGGALIFTSICLMSAFKWYNDVNNAKEKSIKTVDECTNYCDKRSDLFYCVRPMKSSDPKILCYIEWNQNRTQQMIKI